MLKTKNKIIVILGPTASGKSELAVRLARQLAGEIISADSRQVYKGMKIGTGQISKKEMRGIKHYCIDYVSPKKRYTVVDFKKCAERAIKDILSRGKTPIICGGTGFYISAITDGTEIPEVKPNWKLRKKLEKITVEKLFEMLKKLNPARAKNIDAKNPRRLIRAIEIVKTRKFNSSTHASIFNFLNDPTASPRVPELNFLLFGIKLPEKKLKKRIEKRIKKMIRGGLIREAKKLRDSGLSWKRLYELGFEYRYPALFLQSKISKQEMLKRMLLENWHYAKRQMTWFKKYQPKTRWLVPSKVEGIKNLKSGLNRFR